MELAMALAIAVLAPRGLQAKERPIEELPRDVWDVATAWTEPIKSVAKQSRRFDPVSGLWFGMLEGSIKSVERTTALFLQEERTPRGSAEPTEQPLLRYNF
jgi:hypothetical protein